MFFLSRPSPDRIRTLLSLQEHEPFSYTEVGASRHRAPPGYTVDHNRTQLGQGLGAFDRAVKAVQQWKMFDIAWLELCWPETPVEVGATVAVLTSHLGLWSVNPCRIVYVIEEHGSLERYGFAYGTLPEHTEAGEERFSVEFHGDDQTVWYDAYAFSRPKGLARAAYPLSRALQMRFARDSKAAMRNAVERG